MNYAQAPIGWWQDSKGRMQPPGSFMSPSLRVPAADQAGHDGVSVLTSPTRGRFRRWTATVLHQRP
jgi:hypothetical protein